MKTERLGMTYEDRIIECQTFVLAIKQKEATEMLMPDNFNKDSLITMEFGPTKALERNSGSLTLNVNQYKKNINTIGYHHDFIPAAQHCPRLYTATSVDT